MCRPDHLGTLELTEVVSDEVPWLKDGASPVLRPSSHDSPY